jgi:AcrR family transcriptional regulator
MRRPQEQRRFTPRTPKGRNTRDQIIDAAVSHFSDTDSDRTSLTDIARAVPTSTATVHRYFDRQTLFAAAVERQTDQFVAVLGHVLSGDETTADALNHVGAVLPALAADFPLVARLLAGKDPAPAAAVLELPAFDALRQRVADRVRYDQMTGTLRADIDAATVAAGVVTVIISHLVRRLATGHGATGTDDDWAAAATLVSTALRPPAATGG